MGVATSTGNHSNSTSPHRNKAPTRLVTGPSKNWGWNRSTPLSITSAPPPCCGSQGSQQPSGGNPTFSTIFGSFFLLWQRAQKKGVERFHPPLFNITPTPSILRTSRWRATWRRCFQDHCEQFDSLHRKPTSPSALPCLRNAPLASALRGVEPFHPPL